MWPVFQSSHPLAYSAGYPNLNVESPSATRNLVGEQAVSVNDHISYITDKCAAAESAVRTDSFTFFWRKRQQSFKII